MIALSGLDRLASVFRTVEAAEAAQPPAAALRLPSRVAATGPATPAPPDGQRPVSRLPAARPCHPRWGRRTARWAAA